MYNTVEAKPHILDILGDSIARRVGTEGRTSSDSSLCVIFFNGAGAASCSLIQTQEGDTHNHERLLSKANDFGTLVLAVAANVGAQLYSPIVVATETISGEIREQWLEINDKPRVECLR